MFICLENSVYTDHQALKWLLSIRDPRGRLGRWAITLQDKHFDIVHKPGRVHRNADALSRPSYDEDPTPDETGKPSVNVLQTPGVDENKEYVQVNFTYGSAQLVSGVTPDSEYDIQNQKTDSFQSKKKIAGLQKVCPDFKHICHYIENIILPEDKKLVYTTVIEADKYALRDGVLYHHYQPRVKGLPVSLRLVRHIAL